MSPLRPYLSNERSRLPEPKPAPREPHRPPSRLRRILGPALEGGVAVVLTLVCFVALLLVLIRMLPSATDLGDLFTAKEESPQDSTSPMALGGALDPTVWKDITLQVIDNEVLRKEANSIAWKRTKSGARLSFGDGIQTTRQGMAVVTFDRDNHLRIGRNSVVILNQLERDILHDSGPSASFTVVAGEMWGSFRGNASPVQLDVPSANSTTRVEMAGGRPAQFKVTVRDDRTSTISVLRGSMNLRNASGVLAVGEDQYVVVDAAGGVSDPKELLSPPDPLEPADADKRVYRQFPPKLTFKWRATKADEYRIVIARDGEMREIVLEERVSGTTYAVGGLTAGDYWWTVSSVRKGADGPPSPRRHLTIVEDQQPPALQVSFPEARTARQSVSIAGMVDSDAQVFVAGRRAVVRPDGSFSVTAELRPGVNLIVVEAVDGVGNSAYRSREIRRVTEGGSQP
jgi:hypothetical protein